MEESLFVWVIWVRLARVGELRLGVGSEDECVARWEAGGGQGFELLSPRGGLGGG